MRDFNRGGSGDRRGGSSFGRRDGGRDFSRGGRPDMHRATCAECGQSCEVPFKPTGDKPVYCSNCFKGKDGASPRRPERSEGRDFSRPSFGEKEFFKATCDKCGQECEVPFRPTAGKPVYCNNCFGKDDNNRRNSGANASGDQFKALNDKLDKIISLLSGITKKEVAKEVAVKEVKEIKDSKPKKASKKIIKKDVAPKAAKPKKAKKK